MAGTIIKSERSMAANWERTTVEMKRPNAKATIIYSKVRAQNTQILPAMGTSST